MTLAVYHVIRASVAFVPRDHDLDLVRRHLERFYRFAAAAIGQMSLSQQMSFFIAVLYLPFVFRFFALRAKKRNTEK